MSQLNSITLFNEGFGAGREDRICHQCWALELVGSSRGSSSSTCLWPLAEQGTMSVLLRARIASAFYSGGREGESESQRCRQDDFSRRRES